ncbi:MAG TPA: vitamin K epoxide reductase family protein [Dehalococcoidia bacterium]|nr:vitamin K epoxide reductase family protein [Dehalococcoidia bacterium]
MNVSAPPSNRPWLARIGGLGVPGAIALLSALGVFVSSVLLWLHYQSHSPLCTGVGSCQVVNASAYSEVMGLPVALLGLLMYGAILGLSLSLPGATAIVALLGLALAGLLYSCYLTYVEVHILRALCPWCLASQGIIAAIFALSLTLAPRAVSGER